MEYVTLAIVGLLAGLLGGLLGIGGSSVMIPAMVMIFAARGEGERIQQYQAAAMIVNFLLIIPAVTRHAKAKAVQWAVWRSVVPAALAGIVIGVGASQLPFFRGDNQKYMKMLFGVFMIYVACHNVYRLLGRKPAQPKPEPATAGSPLRKIAVGLPMGLGAGLLGIGGGAIAVPALQIVLHLPLRNAIATSAATILATSWVGAIVKNISVQVAGDGTVAESFRLAAMLAPTAMIGSYIGGHLTHTLPLKAVRVAFVALMIFASAKMLDLL